MGLLCCGRSGSPLPPSGALPAHLHSLSPAEVRSRIPSASARDGKARRVGERGRGRHWRPQAQLLDPRGEQQRQNYWAALEGAGGVGGCAGAHAMQLARAPGGVGTPPPEPQNYGSPLGGRCGAARQSSEVGTIPHPPQMPALGGCQRGSLSPLAAYLGRCGGCSAVAWQAATSPSHAGSPRRCQAACPKQTRPAQPLAAPRERVATREALPLGLRAVGAGWWVGFG